ncbi:MAG: tRNA preQ1(34) S-adenosylmethionine ribosyltransferase-isomerase QueA [Clostridiales bacterium]|nr:tRNA preQ1(34) S-adenosylmethionine ribosyltransferase-isomerase QueA [Clostridiales bacterium]
MLTKDFDYELPERLIAQHPMEKRDQSRLLVVDRKTGGTEHRVFSDILDYLKAGDVLVINDSKVIPARLFGRKADSGITVELLLLKEVAPDEWETLVRPGRRVKPGTIILFEDGLLRAEVLRTVEGGNRVVRFLYDKEKYQLLSLLDQVGTMPLPPYITEKLAQKERYQTVYAKEPGSAAAPTAGLHFTEELLDQVRAKGVTIAPVMLHVGLGTFRPVKTERIDEHVMHTEFFSISPESAALINQAKEAGGRVICVGTTSCRTIESASDETGRVQAMCGQTGIFIYPGYQFKTMDALITNFHLPQSTLLMLVSAFASREIMLDAYKTAVENEYRFFSFGDAMLII